MFLDLAHQPEILTSDKKVEDKVEPKKTFEETTSEERGAIINPKHHKELVPGYEFMSFMKHWLPRFKDPVYAGGLMQTMKYLTRLGLKDNDLQELHKARWYLNWTINYLESQKSN